MFQIKSIKNVNIVVNTTLSHKFLLVQPVSLTGDPRDQALFFFSGKAQKFADRTKGKRRRVIASWSNEKSK